MISDFKDAFNELSDADPPLVERGQISADMAFTEMLQLLLDAIRGKREDDEMDCRSTLKARFRLTDEQINTRLLRMLCDTASTKVQATHDGVDLTKIEQLQYLIDGWVPKGDVALLYGAYGCGKTTLALGLAWALAKGLPFLDRTGNGTTGRSLFIATDSGAGPLIKAMDDLGIDPCEPLLTNGDPAQMIWIWAHAPDQGHEAWRADINGVVELKRFIEKNSIDLVLIDSAKSVSSAAGWSYTANESVSNMLRYLRQSVCQPHETSIVFLSHDGTAPGSHSGAKTWAEEPSMVIRLNRQRDDEGRDLGVKAEFKKDRAAVVDPLRNVAYRLNRETGQLLIEPEVEIVGNCSEAVIDILWGGHQRGVKSISRKGLVDEVFRKHSLAEKTVDNTLGSLAGKRRVVKPRRGHYALAPNELQRLHSRGGSREKGRNLERSQSLTGFSPVPDDFPPGTPDLPALPAREVPGTPEIPMLPVDLQQVPPSRQALPYLMEDDESE